MNSQELQAEINRLIPKAETGAQWAEICRLEAEMIAAMCRENSVPYQVKANS
jgi:hypothetical protein